MGDMKGLVRELKEGGALKVKDDVAKHIQKGKLTMRDFGEQLQAITKMGSLDRMVSMIPGLQNMVPQGAGKEGAESIKRMMTLMNSMTDAELDGGRIIAQRAFPYEGDDIGELEAMIHAVEYPLYIETIKKLIE